MKKLLVICGPTSSGKTKLAISLAKKFNGEIVSADSRQVYRGLNIGTGKELPPNSKLNNETKRSHQNLKVGFYEIDGVKIWGYDLADPKQNFSVARYLTFANRIISQIQKANKLPILVGGTGLYIKAVLDGIPTAVVPKNTGLRKNLSGKNAAELFEILAQIDSIKAGGMNSSDRQNPRRLIRAIEIAQYKLSKSILPKESSIGSGNDFILVGLNCPEGTLFAKIEKRVEKRLKNGIEKEIAGLLASGVNWNNQAMNSLGYSEWKDYFEQTVRVTVRVSERKRAIEKWKSNEKKYVKRQLTWFKKDKRINWFNVSEPNWQEKVENLVKKWHN